MATILIKKRDTTGAPATGDLTNSTGGAELAVNTFDKRLYAKDSGGTVVEIGTNPTSITLGSDTLSSFGTGVATFLATPSSTNLAAAVTGETGSGALVFGTSPTLVTPVLGTPTSGNLGNCTVDGTNNIGFLNIPQQIKNSAYTLVLGDSGKHIYKSNTTAYTWTIPANSSVAFPIGTAITFINGGASGDITIAITSDTMRLAVDGTTGSRTLAGYGVATAIKVASTTWIISGNGLT